MVTPVNASPQPSQATAEPAEHRRHDRDSLLLRATLRLGHGYENFDFRVRNLSATGLMGEGPFTIVAGTPVVVELRNLGWIAATVAWSLDNRFGLAFHEEIDPHAVRQPAVTIAPGIPDYVDHVVRRPLVAGKAPVRESKGPARPI